QDLTVYTAVFLPFILEICTIAGKHNLVILHVILHVPIEVVYIFSFTHSRSSFLIITWYISGSLIDRSASFNNRSGNLPSVSALCNMSRAATTFCCGVIVEGSIPLIFPSAIGFNFLKKVRPNKNRSSILFCSQGYFSPIDPMPS